MNDGKNTKVLEEIGIDVNNESVVLENDSKQVQFLIINGCFILIALLIIVSIFLIYNRKKDKELAEITTLPSTKHFE